MPLPMPQATIEEITMADKELAGLLALKEHKLSKRKQDAHAARIQERESEEKRARLLTIEEEQPLGRGCRGQASGSSD